MGGKKKTLPPCTVTPWCGAAAVASRHSFETTAGLQSSHHATAPSASLEAARVRALEKLRELLVSECRAGKTPRYPSMAFERWWYSVRDHALAEGSDPLLPGRARPDDPTLVADLEKVGFPRAQALATARRLAAAARTASAALSRLAASAAAAEAPRAPPGGGISTTRLDGGAVELRYASAGLAVTLAATAFAKLKALYALHASSSSKAAFEAATFSMVLRYRSLGGGGFQLALPTAAFELLRTDFGVLAECFASPLNCWFGRYCSAFPDCDAPFGSLGSFLHFRPTLGAFEANPPFAPSVLAAMREHMHELLEQAEGPLSFIVAVAHWEHAEVQALKDSPFARAHALVPGEEQRWLDGSSMRRAPVDLLLLALQNTAAAAEPGLAATSAKLAALRAACTGDATPLGPRKRPREVSAAPMEATAAVAISCPPTQEPSTRRRTAAPATQAAAAAACPCPPTRRRAACVRPPGWRVNKLRRLVAWRRLRLQGQAAGSFAWTPAASEGWHERNMRFWQRAGAHVDGMTGGGVSEKDLAFSREALAEVVARCQPEAGRFAQALDVGAGIGRVASEVLQRHCTRLDLLEPMAKHLDVARRSLGAAWPGDFIVGTLQDFSLSDQRQYNLIWCQWVLMYVTDADALAFLRRCRSELLARAGVLVVKENVARASSGSYFDDERGELWRERAGASRASRKGAHGDAEGDDAKRRKTSAPMSVLRTRAHYEALFREAGLRVLTCKRQFFSEEEMPMMLFVLF